MADYIIKAGDTLSKIAKRCGVSVEQLQKSNGIKNVNLIFAGKTIQVPGDSLSSDKSIFGNLRQNSDGSYGSYDLLRGLGAKPVYGIITPHDDEPAVYYTDVDKTTLPPTDSSGGSEEIISGEVATPAPTGVVARPVYGIITPHDDEPAAPTGIEESESPYTTAPLTDRPDDSAEITPDEVTTPEPVTDCEQGDECFDIEQKEVYDDIPVPKYRTGNWYISIGYINEDGSELSKEDRAALQKELGKDENQVGKIVENGKFTKIQLKKEITLPSGKIVKLSDDAYDRIMKQDAHGGGVDAEYNIQRHGTMERAVDCGTGQPKTPWMSPDELNKWMLENGAVY